MVAGLLSTRKCYISRPIDFCCQNSNLRTVTVISHINAKVKCKIDLFCDLPQSTATFLDKQLTIQEGRPFVHTRISENYDYNKICKKIIIQYAKFTVTVLLVT